MHPHIQGVGWFVRRSPDSILLREYYRDALGFPQMRGRPQSMMFWVGETSIVQVSPGGTRPPVYTNRIDAPCVPVFRVHDIDSVVSHIKGMGSPLINDLTGEGTRLVYFLDPSGNVFGLQQRTGSAMRPDDHEAKRRWDAGLLTVEGIPAVAVPDVQNLGWIVQRAADTKPVIAFYRDVLQLPYVGGTPDGTIAMFKLDDLQLLEIALGGAEQPRPNDRHDVNNTMILQS